jgi:hypothetical protein
VSVTIFAPVPSAAGLPSSIFGDGSDGNVTINTTVTLTRDMYYDTLTVDTASGILNTAGYAIFCRTACNITNGGAIRNLGPAGTAAAVGSGGAGGTAVVGTMMPGQNGIAGVNGTAAAGGTAGAVRRPI